MCSVAPLAHYGFEVIPRMSTPQMMALDQALAEIEVAPARSRRWAWQLSGMPRQMRAAIGRHRDIIRLRPASFPGGGRTLRCQSACWPPCGPAACRTAGRCSSPPPAPRRAENRQVFACRQTGRPPTAAGATVSPAPPHNVKAPAPGAVNWSARPELPSRACHGLLALAVSPALASLRGMSSNTGWRSASAMNSATGESLLAWK